MYILVHVQYKYKHTCFDLPAGNAPNKKGLIIGILRLFSTYEQAFVTGVQYIHTYKIENNRKNTKKDKCFGRQRKKVNRWD